MFAVFSWKTAAEQFGLFQINKNMYKILYDKYYDHILKYLRTQNFQRRWFSMYKKKYQGRTSPKVSLMYEFLNADESCVSLTKVCWTKSDGKIFNVVQ